MEIITAPFTVYWSTPPEFYCASSGFAKKEVSMERRLLFSLSCVLVLVVTVWLQSVVAGGLEDVGISRDSHDKYKERAVAPWFGPRLGRRKRNPNGDESYRNPATTAERDNLETLFELLQDSPLAIITVNDGKRRTAVDFIPRLGRESGEEISSAAAMTSGGNLFGSGGGGGGGGGGSGGVGSADRWLLQETDGAELMSQRSPPFAPRLGRRRQPLPFSPRLGRRENELNGAS